MSSKLFLVKNAYLCLRTADVRYLRPRLSSEQPGQRLRASGRFGNSGGVHREYYAALYKAKDRGKGCPLLNSTMYWLPPLPPTPLDFIDVHQFSLICTHFSLIFE